MEGQNGKILSHKTNGFKGQPPYSVETPYGFQLDLDFLKYVDDIEKGNTIKRVPIQRRSKVPRASTLPRHLNSSGYRPSPWGSTGALGPRSRQSDVHHYSYTPWSHDTRTPLSPTGFKSQAEIDARIKEFDEQPLGEHIRPHLLRASSLPLTVLLRQGSESTDDPGSLWSSRDHLEGRNTSCEDVFDSTNRSHDCSGLLKRLAEALERVGELEMEVRIIPELRAQICILQEERERLRVALNPKIQTQPTDRIPSCYTPCSYNTVDIKRARHDSHISHRFNNQLDSNPTQEWRTSTDLDELLTVTALQAKVAVLEQKLHESCLKLQRVTEHLKEQHNESKRKDNKIQDLIRYPGVWVKAERVLVEQDGDEMVVKSLESNLNGKQQWDKQQGINEEAPAGWVDTAVVTNHIKQIKRLLDEQWDCLCAEHGAQHIDPRVRSLQEEMMGLVDLLSSYYHQQRDSEEQIQHGASKCGIRKDVYDGHEQLSKSLRFGVDEGNQSTTSVNQNGLKQKTSPGEKMAAAHTDDGPMEGERQTGPDRQIISGGTGSASTDGNTMSAETPEKKSKLKCQLPGEQMEGNSGCDTSAAGRENVKDEFMASCQFLKDHMVNMDNPNDDMRKALVVLFQIWFSAAAEETSKASSVTVHVREVKRNAPSLLAFLINLADDNGNTVLHYSVSHCNYSIVSVLLDTGVADVNLQNNAGYTAMMLASLTAPDGPNGMEAVRRLMELGNTNIQSRQTGQTALHLAVRHGRMVMVRLLLSCGADANIQDKEGTTALMFASERGHTHIARLLLERSQCDLNLADKHGRTALSIAMQGSHSDTATLLKAHAKARAL